MEVTKKIECMNCIKNSLKKIDFSERNCIETMLIESCMEDYGFSYYDIINILNEMEKEGFICRGNNHIWLPIKINEEISKEIQESIKNENA